MNKKALIYVTYRIELYCYEIRKDLNMDLQGWFVYSVLFELENGDLGRIGPCHSYVRLTPEIIMNEIALTLRAEKDTIYPREVKDVVVFCVSNEGECIFSPEIGDVWPVDILKMSTLQKMYNPKGGEKKH